MITQNSLYFTCFWFKKLERSKGKWLYYLRAQVLRKALKISSLPFVSAEVQRFHGGSLQRVTQEDFKFFNYCCGLFQVGQGIQLKSSTSDWADLRNLSVACITRPDTCGPEGAAVAMWIKLSVYNFPACLISSLRQQSTGFYICCSLGGSLRWK